jgi:hypothetical protein
VFTVNIAIMEKLDLKRFDPKTRSFIEKLKDIITAFDVGLINEHKQLAEHAPSGFMDDMHLQVPCVYSLLAYGIPGVRSLFEIASGNSSGAWDAQRALLLAALGKADVGLAQVELARTYLDDHVQDRLELRIREVLEDPGTQAEAKRLLTSLIRGLLTSARRRVAIGQILSSSSLGPLRSEGDALLWEIISKSVLNISDGICDELSEIIVRDEDENVYQSFFEGYPAVLDPLAAEIIPSQVLGEMFATDFVVRRLDDEYIFVEIEKPRDRVFTDYPQPTAALSHALAQVLSWFSWVEDNIAYAHSHGYPGIHSPRGLVIIGRTREMTAAQQRMLKQLNDLLRPRIHIATYDEILQSARNVLTNLTAR